MQFELVDHTMAEVRESGVATRAGGEFRANQSRGGTHVLESVWNPGGRRHGRQRRALRGPQEIINIKHQDLEWFGVTCAIVGTSVPVEMLIEQAVQQEATAVLASLVVSHHDNHRVMMSKLNDMAVARGVRDRFLLIAGWSQSADDLARQCRLDAGFGRGTRGVEVTGSILDSVTTQ